MEKIAAIMNFKGGSGKTTTAAHPAQYLALRGYVSPLMSGKTKPFMAPLGTMMSRCRSKSSISVGRAFVRSHGEAQASPSADRFKAVVDHLKPRRVVPGLPDVMSTPDGDRLAQVKQTKSKVEVTIMKATPGLQRLPALSERTVQSIN